MGTYGALWRRLAVAALCAAALPALADHHGYDIAIAPFLPVRTMVQNYQSMRAYLEQRLGEPVTLVSATDYRTFNTETLQHRYPFIITVANSAYLAQSEASYIPIARPVIDTRPTLVVAKDSKWRSIGDLRGQTVMTSDAMAIVAMQAPRMLHDAGLNPERDVKLTYAENHNSAATRMLAGEAAAAIISDRALLQMSPTTRASLRQLATWEAGAAPGVVYLASPEMPDDRVRRMQAAIFEFVHDTAEGRDMMQRFGYGGLVPMHADELRRYAYYGAQLRELLKGAH